MQISNVSPIDKRPSRIAEYEPTASSEPATDSEIGTSSTGAIECYFGRGLRPLSPRQARVDGTHKGQSEA